MTSACSLEVWVVISLPDKETSTASHPGNSFFPENRWTCLHKQKTSEIHGVRSTHATDYIHDARSVRR
jgi:hypothetical protein